jgi:hypothetical protein
VERSNPPWPVWLPAPDPERSPRTGWTRAHWAALADRMLLAVRPHASPGHARILLPGAEGGYGRDVDGLEGFARTFLLAGFRLAGAAADGVPSSGGPVAADDAPTPTPLPPPDLAEWYAAGVAEGVDPGSRNRWVRLTEHDQAKVEAASLALTLDATRDQIWDRLPFTVRERVVDYLAPVVGDRGFPRNNWLWFRIVVQTFLRSVGGPWSRDDIEEDLALHDSFAREGGWLADGDGRDFDHYTGWALHLYPTLWQRMDGARDLAADARRARDRDALAQYLADAVHLVGADGAPLAQGRSLIYRFASAAPFWVGAMAGAPTVPPGLARRAASGIVQHFVAHGAPNPKGLLTVGWHRAWRRLAQSYSGPGSPYWASKGFLGLALPATHPVWTAREAPLPVERGDVTRPVVAPGWLIHASAEDGIVQVLNHGTDHAREGDLTGDSPLYARLGYSTATFPLLDDASWRAPVDQSVTLVDPSGRSTHRAGMRTLVLTVDDDGPGLAASTHLAHWLAPARAQQHHGSGFQGEAEVAGRVTVLSIARAGWEVRGVLVEELAPDAPAPLTLRIGGWAVAGPGTRWEQPARVGSAGAQGSAGLPARGAAAGAEAGGLESTVWDLSGGGVPGMVDRGGASPLGTPAWVPHLDHPARVGAWVWTAVQLTRQASADEGEATHDRVGSAIVGVITPAQWSAATRPPPAIVHGPDRTITVTWPDGVTTRTAWPPELPASSTRPATRPGAGGAPGDTGAGGARAAATGRDADAGGGADGIGLMVMGCPPGLLRQPNPTAWRTTGGRRRRTGRRRGGWAAPPRRGRHWGWERLRGLRRGRCGRRAWRRRGARGPGP